ncbi:MAG: hypothetical protein JXA54_11595 [Candidatus Heimdallarchaeota archaeon]|nr:hypothetical protein [Candidatus Heimdallarchaeota archaeon]
MKLRIKLLGISVLLLTTFSLVVSPVLGYVEQYGWEYTNEGGKVSKVKIQAHAVYNDNDQGGVTAFGVWVNGNYDTTYDTRITVKIYATAKYHEEKINWRTMTYTERDYWSYTPLNLLSWNQEYDYCGSVPTVWRWTTGVTAYGMSLSATYQHNPTASAGTGSGTSDGYRYLGWFRSQYNDGGHEFSALLKLHLINDAAIAWDNGMWEMNWPYEILTTVEEIRIKLVFEFSYYAGWLFGWQTPTIRTYIMGDGSPSTDLNYIPLVEGTIN